MTKYIALVFLFLVPLSIAHLEGESQTAGGYKIELSTLPEELMTWKNSDIIIAIENATTGERIPGAAFWARLSLNGTAILSSNFVANDAGLSTVNYIFQKAGHYQLDVAPSNNTATFHVRVLEEYKPEGVGAPLYMAAAAAVFFIIGLTVGFIFFRRVRK